MGHMIEGAFRPISTPEALTPQDNISSQRARELIGAVKPYLLEVEPLMGVASDPFPFVRFQELEAGVKAVHGHDITVTNNPEAFTVLHQFSVVENALAQAGEQARANNTTLTVSEKRNVVRQIVGSLDYARGPLPMDESFAYKTSVREAQVADRVNDVHNTLSGRFQAENSTITSNYEAAHIRISDELRAGNINPAEANRQRANINSQTTRARKVLQQSIASERRDLEEQARGERGRLQLNLRDYNHDFIQRQRRNAELKNRFKQKRQRKDQEQLERNLLPIGKSREKEAMDLLNFAHRYSAEIAPLLPIPVRNHPRRFIRALRHGIREDMRTKLGEYNPNLLLFLQLDSMKRLVDNAHSHHVFDKVAPESEVKALLRSKVADTLRKSEMSPTEASDMFINNVIAENSNLVTKVIKGIFVGGTIGGTVGFLAGADLSIATSAVLFAAGVDLVLTRGIVTAMLLGFITLGGFVGYRQSLNG